MADSKKASKRPHARAGAMGKAQKAEDQEAIVIHGPVSTATRRLGGYQIGLDQRAWKGLVIHKYDLKSLLTKAVEMSTSGGNMRLTVDIDPHGKLSPKIVKIVRVRSAASPTAKDQFDTELAQALARGERRAVEILAAPDMLSAAAFARAIGVSREAVRRKRQRHEVLGLEGAKRGVRFPVWQVTSDGGLLPALPRLFDLLGGSPWTVYRFLLQHHPELEGATAIERLKAGEADKVLAAAENASRAFS